MLSRHNPDGAGSRRSSPTLYATTHTAPSSMVTPLRKLISTTGGKSETGSIHHTISARPASVNTTRSGPRSPARSSTQRASSAAPTIPSATPPAYARLSRCSTAKTTRSGPATGWHHAQHQRPPTRCRRDWIRLIAYGRDDAEATRPPGGRGDRDEGQHHPQPVAGGDARRLDDRFEVEAVLLDETLRQADDAECQGQPGAQPKQRRDQAVQPAFDRQQQDDVTPPGAQRAGDAELGAPLERHQREHQHDQQHAAEQRKGPQHDEQVGEGAAPAIGLVLGDALDVDDPEPAGTSRGCGERRVAAGDRAAQARREAAEDDRILNQGAELGVLCGGGIVEIGLQATQLVAEKARGVGAGDRPREQIAGWRRRQRSEQAAGGRIVDERRAQLDGDGPRVCSGAGPDRRC